ncbi:MAG: hypothetical protein EON58_09290 [Alphaproteobacteria bacterium]|nr:MAG: hypothetical protein EON58_09290 [Alphaproteobacteria bacterium]
MIESVQSDKFTPKSRVIEYLFNQRFDPNLGDFSDPIITSDALKEAIVECNKLASKKLSTNNPANFLKDFLRSPRRNELWPQKLKDARISARQKYRKKRVFAFVPYDDEQSEPFPDRFVLEDGATEHLVESVSLPFAARALGRKDEAWLIQVCVHQRIIQSQFALHSVLSSEVVDFFHLQNSVKMTPEIDAIFLLTLRRGKQLIKALVTLEAKRNEPILIDQIRAQVAIMSKQCKSNRSLADISFIIPVAARSEVRLGHRIVGVFEMAPIPVDTGASAHDNDEEHLIPLEILYGVPYRLKPEVSGI